MPFYFYLVFNISLLVSQQASLAPSFFRSTSLMGVGESCPSTRNLCYPPTSTSISQVHKLHPTRSPTSSYPTVQVTQIVMIGDQICPRYQTGLVKNHLVAQGSSPDAAIKTMKRTELTNQAKLVFNLLCICKIRFDSLSTEIFHTLDLLQSIN